MNQGCQYRWCQGCHWQPQFLADQLTLFQPGRADYSHQLLMVLPNFVTFKASLDLHLMLVFNFDIGMQNNFF